ncbi:MAG TPA: hypothetical protein VFP13_02005 [Actinomycetota bacterium]|nr:hypothetical protein [Actinomycetota bacterium]
MRTDLLEPPATGLVEPIHAWRTWTLVGSRDGAVVRLAPIAGDGRPWPPRRPARSLCTRRRSHLRPELDCTCGLHAVTDPDDLRRARDPAVLGTVALWGTIVEHERGFRAALAYPQRLRLLCYLCFSLWGRLGPGGCEVVVRHRGGRMVPLCEPHLELSRRYGYRVPRLLPARSIESTLLSTYAVDPLRELGPVQGRAIGAGRA